MQIQKHVLHRFFFIYKNIIKRLFFMFVLQKRKFLLYRLIKQLSLCFIERETLLFYLFFFLFGQDIK
jgi:hypothetical protein